MDSYNYGFFKEYIFIIKNTWKDKQLSVLTKGVKSLDFRLNFSICLQSFNVRTELGLVL